MKETNQKSFEVVHVVYTSAQGCSCVYSDWQLPHSPVLEQMGWDSAHLQPEQKSSSV